MDRMQSFFTLQQLCVNTIQGVYLQQLCTNTIQGVYLPLGFKGLNVGKEFGSPEI